MKYIDLPNGAKMPALGFGTWELVAENCYHAVLNAIKQGFRHIDTAQVYGNEWDVGRAIADSGVARKDLFVTTKLWAVENLRYDAVKETLEQSLLDLNRLHPNPYADLVLIHWPNPNVPLDETMRALKEFVDEGKVRHVGVSNFPVADMQKAVTAAEKHGLKIACNQVEHHVLLNQDAVKDFARKHGIAVTSYSPLAHGELLNNATLEPILTQIAKKHNVKPAQVALRWLVDQEGVAAIPKASNPEHIRESFDIFGFQLDAADREALNKINAVSNLRTCNPTAEMLGIEPPKWDEPPKVTAKTGGEGVPAPASNNKAPTAFNGNKAITVGLGVVSLGLLVDGIRRLVTKGKGEPNKSTSNNRKIIGALETAGGFVAAIAACKTGGLFRK